MSNWNYPVTDTELDAFWGTPASPEQVGEAIGVASAAVDFTELTDELFSYENQILDAIAEKDMAKVGELVALARRERIARIASKKLFGREGVIKESEVKV